jgi:fatty-acyl-CoA synthase
VVFHHRGAYLNSASNIILGHAAARRLSVDAADVPLQRLVLPWTLAANAGVSVCLRKVDRR